MKSNSKNIASSGAISGERSAIIEEENKNLRKYLLGQLTEADEERLELRLLTDRAMAEQFDIAVEEVTDQYVEGELNSEEREQAERHFFNSAERREQLGFAAALKEAAKSRRKWRPLTTYLLIAASVLVLFGAGISIWRASFPHQSELDRGLTALNSAYREQRPIESRISDLGHAPFPQTRSGGIDTVNNDELRRAERTLLDALTNSPTPALHHALGEVYLAKKQFDKAIKEFEEALQAEPNNAKLLSDLGAAWQEKSRIDQLGPAGPAAEKELGRSLENLNRALQIDNRLPEALFNRALCYEALTRTAEAQNDWRKYLELDSTSKWAVEANQHLRTLANQRPPVSGPAQK